MIKIDSTPALVIGGGKIAFRKAQSIIEYGGSLEAISPMFCAEFEDLIAKHSINVKRRKFIPGDTALFNPIFVATADSFADNIIHEECINTGKLINVADVPSLCNFIMPANIKRGSLIVSFSTQGEAPFYAKVLKDRYESEMPETTELTIALAANLRKRLLNNPDYPTIESRGEILEAFAKYDWDAIIKKQSYEFALNLVNKLLEKK